MKNSYRLNTFLAVVTGLVSLVMMLYRTFSPAAILPPLDILMLSGISLAALVLEHYLGGTAKKRHWLGMAVFSALTFALLPLAAGLLSGIAALKFAAVGCAVFLALAFLFTSVCDRLATGNASPVAPLLSAGILFLAVQAFASMLL